MYSLNGLYHDIHIVIAMRDILADDVKCEHECLPKSKISSPSLCLDIFYLQTRAAFHSAVHLPPTPGL